MSVRTSPACCALSVCVCVCVCVGSNSNLLIGWYFVIRFNCMCTVLRFYERTCIVLSSTFQFCIYQPPPIHSHMWLHLVVAVVTMFSFLRWWSLFSHTRNQELSNGEHHVESMYPVGDEAVPLCTNLPHYNRLVVTFAPEHNNYVMARAILPTVASSTAF